MPDAALSQSDPLIASLQALPTGVHVVLGAGVAAGLVLWLAGGRVARPMFGLIGVVVGASLGFFIAPLLATDPINDIPTPYLGLAMGGLLGMGISIALFQFTMAIGAAAVLGLASMVGTSVVLDHLHPEADGEPTVVAESPDPEPESEPDRFRDAVESAAIRTAIDTTLDRTEGARQTAERTREFLDRAGQSVHARWERVPGQHRLMVAAGGVAGAFLGFMVGVFMPRRAAALVTALAGSAMWLACGTWTAHATGAPGLAMLSQPKQVWLIIWPATAALGLFIQWIGIVHGRKSPG